MKTNIRSKIIKFLKKNGRIIGTVLIIVLVIYGINAMFRNYRNNNTPTTSYEPEVAVLSSEKMPTKVQKTTEDFIAEYVEYCNNGEYEKAYNMISDDCKNNYFLNFSNYKEYVQNKFYTKRKYSVQSYSKYNDKYIYNLRLFDDFMATGLTNSTYRFQEEKITASYDENNKIVFCVGNFIAKETMEGVQENDYLKVDIVDRILCYNYEKYTVRFTNRCDHTVVIQDGNAGEEEVLLDVGQDYRGNENSLLQKIILRPGESKEVPLLFRKFFDDNNESKSIVLNNVRIMDNYTGNVETAAQEIDNAIDKLSITVGMKVK